MTNPTTVYIVATCIAMLVGLISMIVISAKGNKRDFYEEQLAELARYSEYDELDTKVTLVTRWNDYWAVRFKSMGWKNYANSNARAGRDVAFVVVFLMVVIGVTSRNPFAAVGLTAAMLYAFSLIIKNQGHKKSEQVNDQLPGFLFALKSNVQANQTPESAILKIADRMPAPLYDDLMIAKQRLLANATFQEAIEEMGQRTASRDLKFLCACMVQAANTGAPLENQLDIIQNVLTERRKVAQELQKAMKAVAPSMWVSTLVLPTTFIALYALSATAREFWFHGFVSWVAFGLLVALYVFGMWMSKKIVDGVRNL